MVVILSGISQFPLPSAYSPFSYHFLTLLVCFHTFRKLNAISPFTVLFIPAALSATNLTNKSDGRNIGRRNFCHRHKNVGRQVFVSATKSFVCQHIGSNGRFVGQICSRHIDRREQCLEGERHCNMSF